MGAVKEWAIDLVYELKDAGYSEEEIASKLDTNIEFVHAIIGAD